MPRVDTLTPIHAISPPPVSSVTRIAWKPPIQAAGSSTPFLCGCQKRCPAHGSAMRCDVVKACRTGSPRAYNRCQRNAFDGRPHPREPASHSESGPTPPPCWHSPARSPEPSSADASAWHHATQPGARAVQAGERVGSRVAARARYAAASGCSPSLQLSGPLRSLGAHSREDAPRHGVPWQDRDVRGDPERQRNRPVVPSG